MARHAIAVAITALLLGLALQPSSAQQQDLVNSAKQRNVVNVQFYADSNLQQTMTPFAYYDFPAIQAGSCSACEDFPGAPTQWGSAVIAYSPTGGEGFEMYTGARCTGQVVNTGALAQTMPPSLPLASFKICRTASRK